MKTKERILLATIELAAISGLGNVSLSQIADAVGIRKATLYSHFSSKDELIEALYEYLREKARNRVVSEPMDYGKLIEHKTAKDVLLLVVRNYEQMNGSDEMMGFYRFIMSERVFSDAAAKIMLEETNRMIIATKQLFYAMKAHGMMDFKDVDFAAEVFAHWIHDYMDMNGDKRLCKMEVKEDELEGLIEKFCKMF